MGWMKRKSLGRGMGTTSSIPNFHKDMRIINSQTQTVSYLLGIVILGLISYIVLKKDTKSLDLSHSDEIHSDYEQE